MSDQPISQSVAIRDANKSANAVQINDDRSMSVKVVGSSVTSDVNLTEVGGAAIALGQATMAASIPVAIASNQSNVPSNIAAAGGVAVVAGTAPVPVGFYNPVGGALLDPTAAAEVVGNVAAGATDSGKPVKVGGVYNTTFPTLTNGQRGDTQLTARGASYVSLVGSSGQSLTYGPPTPDGIAAQTGMWVVSQPVVYNGSTWDRLRNAGSNLGLLAEAGPYLLGRATADAQIKGSAGFIHTVSIAPLTATPTAGLLTVYNSLTETGTIVYAEYIFATTPGHTVTLDIPCGTGIYVGFDGTLANVQVTVAYR